jgi:hypothetical protein
VQHQPAQDRRPDREEPVLEAGEDSEIPAAAAQAPEQVRMLFLARPDHPPVGQHHLSREQRVCGQAVLARQPAHAAAEGEPGDPGVADHAGRGGQPVRLRRRVELGEEHAGLRPDGPPGRVDLDRLHGRQVDHQSAIAGGVAADAVPAAPHRERQPRSAGELERRDHIGGAGAAEDRRRPPVDYAVPEPAGRVVGGLARPQDLAAQRRAQPVQRPGREPGKGLGARRRRNWLHGTPPSVDGPIGWARYARPR